MNWEILHSEFKFKAIRSSGPGGQHANKVASKVQLMFGLENSEAFTEEEKELLIKNLKTKLTKENVLIISSAETRSQHKNKEIVIDKLQQIIIEGLKVPIKRKATKPSKVSIKKRLEKKKKQAFKKAIRRKPKID